MKRAAMAPHAFLLSIEFVMANIIKIYYIKIYLLRRQGEIEDYTREPWQDGVVYHFLVVDILDEGGHNYEARIVEHGDVTSPSDGFSFDELTGAEPVALTLPFEETFSSGDLSAWQMRFYYGPDTHSVSNWTVEEGRLYQRGNFYSDSPAPGYEGTYVRTWETGWSDYALTVELGSGDDDALGVMFRYRDDDNYYRFSMDSQRGYRRLVRKLAGTFETLFEDSVAYEAGLTHTFYAALEGSNIAISLDGVPWADVDDASHGSGGIGLYTWGSEGAWFDNISVTD